MSTPEPSAGPSAFSDSPLADPAMHMSREAFLREGQRMLELIADYLEHGTPHPVMPPTKPGDVLNQLPRTADDRPAHDAWERIFADIDAVVMPNTLHWQSPSFFGYFPTNTSGPSILGDLFSAGLGIGGMLWQTAPASNEIERAVLDQIGRAMEFPERFLSTSANGGGCTQPTASDSTLVSLVAARGRVHRATGADPATMTVYASSQAHSSVMKAAMIAGFARSADDHTRVRLIRTDDEHRLDPSALAEAIRNDIEAGFTPAFVCGTIGTTGLTAVDPVDEIAKVMADTGVAARGAWLHVDAAHAGVLLLCDEFRWMATGLEHADSLCVNPHKWLLTNFDCDLFWTADRRSLIASLSITPEYLRNDATETGAVFDYRDWGVPLGRRFRAAKLWFVLRHYGLDNLRAYLREHVRLAQLFESLVQSDSRFELLAPRTMNLVCFALRSGDEPTRALMAAVNASGKAFLTHTTMPTPAGERFVIRMAIGSVSTREQHVRDAWALMTELAGGV